MTSQPVIGFDAWLIDVELTETVRVTARGRGSRVHQRARFVFRTEAGRRVAVLRYPGLAGVSDLEQRLPTEGDRLLRVEVWEGRPDHLRSLHGTAGPLITPEQSLRGYRVWIGAPSGLALIFLVLSEWVMLSAARERRW